MQPPKQYTARLEEKIVHNERFIQYSFELAEPHEMPFEAGQYVSVKVSEKGERRSYSICSSPDIKHGFELLIDISPGGIGSKYFEALDFGATIEFLGPLGMFTLAPNDNEAATTFVATGSGIAPFRSMILDLCQEKKDTRSIILYWGLRHENILFWEDEFEELAENFPNFKFHPVISQSSEAWPLCRGRVTDCLRVHDLPANSGYYLCGSTQMIADVSGQLIGRGVLAESIHHEKFY